MALDNKKFIVAAVLAGTIGLSSCGKYEDGPGFSLRGKTGRLTGDAWEVKDIENENLNGVDIEMTFDKDGDFEIKYVYDNYVDTYDGEWEFSSDKEDLEIEIDNFTQDWEILRLTNSEFWFEDEANNKWELSR